MTLGFLKQRNSRRRFEAGAGTKLASAVVAFLAVMPAANAGGPPEIRLSPANQVPACVTPDRLMTFLKVRKHSLDPRFKDIATYYKRSGEAWNVRWDYAFYQMAIETNFLTYKRPDGKWGDVDPKQNNFAGIGTTGGGVPGDGFPDVKTGVLGQIQHLVAYSGERMEAPVAARTQLKQDDIILESQKLGRPVRFSDLARRWAVDPKYGSSIEWVADAFRSEQCKGGDGKQAAVVKEVLPWAIGAAAAGATVDEATVKAAPVPAIKPVVKKVALAAAPVPAPAASPNLASAPAPVATANTQNAARTVWVSSPRGQPIAATDAVAALTPVSDTTPVPATSQPGANATPPSGLGAKPLLEGKALPCRVSSASYGGKKTILIKAAIDGEQRYTALTVLDGFEKSMTETFLKSRAPGGETLGEFPDQKAAITKAHELCPGS